MSIEFKPSNYLKTSFNYLDNWGKVSFLHLFLPFHLIQAIQFKHQNYSSFNYPNFKTWVFLALNVIFLPISNVSPHKCLMAWKDPVPQRTQAKGKRSHMHWQLKC